MGLGPLAVVSVVACVTPVDGIWSVASSSLVVSTCGDTAGPVVGAIMMGAFVVNTGWYGGRNAHGGASSLPARQGSLYG